MSKKGLSLLEILVSCVILSLTLIGLANIFVSAKRYILHSRARMAGGELGRLFLEPLQMHVRQDTWNQTGNALNIGVTYCGQNPQNPICPSEANRTLDRIVYNATYDITNHPNAPNIRKVVVNIRWNEPSP